MPPETPHQPRSNRYADKETERIITGQSNRSQNEIVVGTATNPFSSDPQLAKIPHTKLHRGLTIPGDAGYGKSTLVVNILTQLANDGFGFAYFDPKGDETIDLLQRLPENRLSDVKIIGHHPHDETISGVDLLDSRNDSETPPDIVLQSILTELDCYLGPDILESIKIAWDIAERTNRQISELHTVFKMDESDFREYDITITDEIDEYIINRDSMNEDLSPILRRLQPLYETPVLDKTFSTDGISLYDSVEKNDILLIHVSRYTREQKRIIGTALLGKLYEVLIHTKTNSTTLYPVAIDNIASEFNSSNDIIKKYISESRSTQSPFICSLQYPDQLPTETRKHILSVVGNVMSFGVTGPQAINELKRYLDIDNNDDLLKLSPFRTISKIHGINGIYSGEIDIFPLIEPLREEDDIPL